MSTTTFDITYEAGPSRVEVELLLRAAARAATPEEHSRAQVRRVTGRLASGLAAVAGGIALYDVALLLGGS